MIRRLTEAEREAINKRAESATNNIIKRRDTREETTVEKKVSFANIMGTKPVEVTKGSDVVEFEFKDGVLRRVDPDIVLDSPKSEDATRDGSPAAARFPTSPVASAADGHGDPMAAVPKPFDLHSAGTMQPELVADDFMAPGESEMFSPAGFKAPKPKDRPVGDVEQLDGDASGTGVMQGSAKQGRKMGTASYILRSEF